MERYKSQEFRQLQQIYFDYNEGVISDDEAMTQLQEMNILPKYLLQEMSIIKTIVNYINYYSSVKEAHNGTDFEKVSKGFTSIYTNYLLTKGISRDDMSFVEFIEWMLSENKYSKQEIKGVRNIKLFWDFVADVEKYINLK